MSEMRAAKQLLRKEVKSRLNNLKDEDKIKQSNDVIARVLQHEKYKHSKRLSIFLSMNDEIKTDALVEHALKNNKAVFIPKYIGSNMDMVKLNSIEDMENLPMTKWNIKQPSKEDTTREDALVTGGLDLIIMPGLGFTKDGKRLGRGKGYYDTYLAKLSKSNSYPYLLAVAYSCQICDDIPVDEHDKKVDFVIIPSS